MQKKVVSDGQGLVEIAIGEEFFCRSLARRAGRGVAFPSPTTPTLASNKFYVDVTFATLK